MKTIIIAPHADDELLGCGGTLLRRNFEGVETGWLLLTNITKECGWSMQKIKEKSNQIESVRKGLLIKNENFFCLDIPATKLELIPSSDLIKKISEVIKNFKPNEIFLPNPSDIHSDHRYTFECALSCTKNFRYPYINRLMTYETLSETEYGIDPRFNRYNPNVFIDITNFFDKKINLVKTYKTEIKDAPFPRSIETIEALSKIRGSQMGVKYAESFSLLFDYS